MAPWVICEFEILGLSFSLGNTQWENGIPWHAALAHHAWRGVTLFLLDSLSPLGNLSDAGGSTARLGDLVARVVGETDKQLLVPDEVGILAFGMEEVAEGTSSDGPDMHGGSEGAAGGCKKQCLQERHAGAFIGSEWKRLVLWFI